MKTYRHVYLDFPDFTQESCYEVTSKVTFQNGVEDEIKTTVVCDDPYDAMKMVKEFLLSKKDWLVTEVHGQWFESSALLVTKPEIPQPKYVIVCDSIKYIFGESGRYEEVEHYSVIYTIPSNSAIYYGTCDTKEAADERCERLNKKWEECFGGQNERKAKQLLDELEMLGKRSDFWYEDFWITRSPIGGYTVVSVKRTITEHFSNAQRVVDFLSKYDKSLR